MQPTGVKIPLRWDSRWKQAVTIFDISWSNTDGNKIFGYQDPNNSDDSNPRDDTQMNL